MISHRAKRARQRRRSGVAAVEFAICLPVLALLFLGSLECANVIFLKQTLAISSYEGIRKAIQFDATNAEAVARCSAILTARNVVSPSIALDPPDVSQVAPGTPIRVTVSANCAANSILRLQFFGGQSMSVTTTMVKE